MDNYEYLYVLDCLDTTIHEIKVDSDYYNNYDDTLDISITEQVLSDRGFSINTCQYMWADTKLDIIR